MKHRLSDKMIDLWARTIILATIEGWMDGNKTLGHCRFDLIERQQEIVETSKTLMRALEVASGLKTGEINYSHVIGVIKARRAHEVEPRTYESYEFLAVIRAVEILESTDRSVDPVKFAESIVLS